MIHRSETPSNAPYDLIACDLTMKRVHLEVARFCLMQEIDPRAMAMGMEASRVHDAMARHMVMKLAYRVASKKYDAKTVSFPADWWQAVKRRWFPRWALKRWPVVFTDVTMEANAYYPEIEIPDRAAFVEVVMQAKERGL